VEKLEWTATDRRSPQLPVWAYLFGHQHASSGGLVSVISYLSNLIRAVVVGLCVRLRALPLPNNDGVLPWIFSL
jgi:hypothetical protein